MRLTQIKQILEIEKCTSISQAARNLYISQPGLSASLHDFETEIGTTLFARDKSGVTPTEDGKLILEAMKTIMHEVDYIQNYAAKAETLSGNFEFTVGSSYEFLYAELIQCFKTDFPNADLILNNQFAPNIADMVSKGMLDAAIIALYSDKKYLIAKEEFAAYQNLEILPLKNCYALAVLHSAHRYAQQTELLLSQLTREQVIFWAAVQSGNFYETAFLRQTPDLQH